jgi:hypothetical protein
MTTGAIAYKFLKQNSPSTIPKVIAILKGHPQFASRWKAKYDSLPANEKDMFLFMAAARWPDDARMSSFDHPEWHYYDNPIAFSASTTQPPKPDNSVVEIENNLNTVKSASATDADKAVALCWVFHLMGDLHQPLHNVTLFSPVFPNGDRGGNSFLIHEPAKELHKYWDDVFLSDDKANYKASTWFTAVDNAATTAITKNHSVTFNNNAVIDPKAISTEGVAIAKASVYKYKGKLLIPGVKGGVPGVALPAGYSAAATKIASKQVTLAGMRLAVELSKSL